MSDPIRRGAGQGAERSPMRFALPIVAGVVVGSALWFGYGYVSNHKAEQQALAAAPGDPDMAKPTADECAIAQAALSAIHAAGSDATWRKAADAKAMSLTPHSKVINPTDVAGYTDDEADNLRGKAAADWRGCPGMAAFIGGFGWSAMGGDEAIPELALGRPGMSKAGDEARVYEAFMAPDPNSGGLLLSRGPWLVTLKKSAAGAWQVASTDDLKKVKLHY